ncbi:hypothetical protein [Hyalangium versicolor]|uniref:hypothetical protein n=1 Tax=Hyalangium versicolor TaxID=2861190 RepID=UPI001CC979C4|nr:hypothetical protein [Hyalangium versicolor]
MFSWDKFKEVKSALEEELTLEKFHSEMIQLMGSESANHYRMGRLYNRAVEKKLAEAAGYKNAQDYITQKLPDVSYGALRMYGSVAASFSEANAVRFGVTCSYLLLTYKEVADLEINHDEPGGTLIEVPGASGAVESKPFSACSVEEMRKAIQRKRKPSSSKPLPAEHVALAGLYQSSVSTVFPKGVVVKVEVRNQKGKAVLDITGIPVEQVNTLIKALGLAVPMEIKAEPMEAAPPTA